MPTNPKEAVTPFDRELKKLKEIWSKEYLLQLAKEFKETPFGTHSEDLQHLLNIMRGAPIPGKYMIYMPDSNKTYIIAQHDTKPPYEPVLTDMEFTNFIDAEWPVFCLRFEEMFGFNPRITVHLRDTMAAVLAAQAQLKAELGKDPKPEEIAKEAGVSVDKVELALGVANTVSKSEE